MRLASAPIRVLIVDDDDAFASSVAAWLEAEDGIEVVGRAANGAEALEQVAARRPDVVTMDLQMPLVDGVQATRALRARYPGVRVLLVNGAGSGELLEEALAAGVVGRVLKVDAARTLASAIRQVARIYQGGDKERRPGCGNQVASWRRAKRVPRLLSPL